MSHIVNPRNIQWDFLTNDDGTLADVLGPNGTRNYFMRGAVDASGNITGLVGAFYGSLTSGVWFKVPSIFRLRLTGTGTVVMDSKDSLGNITASVASYSPSAATDQIEFPYAGEDAVMIRVTLTGSAAVEVI